MSVKDAAKARLMEKALLGALTDLHKGSLDELAGGLDPGDRINATAPDGTRLGYVQLTDPDVRVRVGDKEAFLAWVEANHPDEVVTVRQVRPSYQKALLALGGVDPETGEVADGIVDSDPVLRLVPSNEAKALAVDLLPRLPELTQ